MDPVLIDAPAIRALDLRPLEIWSTQPLDALLSQGPVLELRFDWPRAQDDPRQPRDLQGTLTPRPSTRDKGKKKQVRY